MLIRLLPEQVARNWDVIKYAIEESLPPIAEKDNARRMGKILESLLLDLGQCWISRGKEGIDAIITTVIVTDTLTGARSILLYSVFAYEDGITDESWAEGFDTITKFGRAKGCSTLSAYTMLDKIKDLAIFVGGSADYTYIDVPIGG